MEHLGSLNDLNDRQVFPTNQLRDNSANEGEHHVQDPQLSPHTTEEVIVTSGVRPDHQAQDHIVLNMDVIISNPHSPDNLLSIQSPVALQVGLSSVIDLILGPNQSDPIWRLRLLTTFTLVVATMIAVLYLPANLHGIYATYRSVLLITTVGFPIVVAAVSLFLTFCLASDPHGRSHLITGLLVGNFSMLVCSLVVCWALKRGTDN